jgi:protein TonB
VHTPGAGLAGPGDRPAPAEAAPTTAPAAAAPEAQEPPRFAMTLGHGVRAGHSAGPSVIAPAGEGHSGDQESARSDAAGDRGEPFGEGDVSERARPIASSLPDYPPAARTAEIEADVELEIVVDAGGRVIAARAVSRNGYGLDEAALRAVERYRFSPARRGGRPVPVRMRWTVQFRLR